MGIAKYKPLNNKPPINLNTIEAKSAASIVIDNEFTPVTSLTQYVSGFEWNVDYFSQILTNSTDLREHDHSQRSIYQQYTKINKLAFKVINPLTESQNAQTNEFIVTGSATIHPYIIPNAGDMFEADVGQGRYGIFRISRVEKKTIQLESVFDIDYSLVFYKDADSSRYIDLIDKVVREFHYHKDFVSTDQNPLLIDSDYKLIKDVTNAYDTLLDTYLSMFLSNQFSTLIVPSQQTPVYDHYITNFLLTITETFEHPDLKKIRLLNTDKDIYLANNTVLDTLIARDFNLIKKVTRYTALTSTKNFNKVAILDGVRFSGIPLIVYPDSELETKIRSFTPAKQTIDKLHIDSSTANTLIYPVNLDGNYILSSNYYEQTATQSTLERELYNLSTGRSISIAKLNEIINKTDNFTDIELFYYVPLILLLIKSVVNSYE